MKLPRFAYESRELADFFAEGLQSIGAVCERTWHDRLQVLAESKAATLWRESEPLVEVELWFPSASDTQARDAAREVFPGCPLTFRLAELLRGNPLALDRAAIRFEDQLRAPSPETAARLWHNQFPNSGRWEQLRPFSQDWAFSLLLLLRCEVQAIDQHWSLHRVGIAWPDGAIDDDLTSRLDFAQVVPHAAGIAWPAIDPAVLRGLIQKALQQELTAELATIQTRQDRYLRREIERIDEYFANYERELQARKHSRKEHALRFQERLAASRQEHERRRQDQVQRHEIRVLPHIDSLLLLAEPCWKTSVQTGHPRASIEEAVFLPRSRFWRLVRRA